MKQLSSLALLSAAALLVACGTGGGIQPTSDAGSSGGCPQGRTACAGQCVDTQSDPTNCGSCGFGCAQGTVCFGGLCLSSCGNGQLQSGEQCDDNNRQNGDGCSSTCQKEQGYSCTGTPSVCTTRCGDGVKAPAEACDDGDNSSGDGCSATCAIESGYSCTTADPSVCTTVCGDGVIVGAETCDDNDAQGGDGCSAQCTVESGFTCVGVPSVCNAVCGDGVRAGTEECDDGDTFGNDGCASNCSIETGYTCNTASPNVCNTTCGDGIKAGAETCDDGNTTSGNGCSASCQLEAGWTCNNAQPNVCFSTCGDGVRVGTEACDDGDLQSGDGCSSSCTLETGYSCNTATPNLCTTTCGDGLKAGTEACDDGNTTSGNGCSSTCQVETGWSCNAASPNVCTPICGDGIKRGTEACDDSNPNSNDGCSSSCQVESGWSCNTAQPSVCTRLCGNGVKSGTEQCDDGNPNDNDGCSSACTLETGFTCSTATPNVCTAICGDGQRKGAETCDDQGQINGDGCSSTCQVEQGYACNTATPNVCAPVCGDGLKKGTEQCDDGNPNNNDGCSSTCVFEPGFTCNTATPNVCSPICSDGVRRGSETCDDGDLDPGDGCSATCQVEFGYTCDTATPNNCTVKCGDRVVFGTEQCDDGNTTSGDCCSSTCTLEPGCEREVNDTLATANDFRALSLDGGSLKAFLGDGGTDIRVTNDVDVFSFYLDGGSNSLLLRTGTGAYGSACSAGGIDNKISIRSADGGLLASDDDSISAYCAMASMQGQPAGLYYVEVKVGAFGDTVSDYTLIASYGVCGNGIKDVAEQCEDGNTVDTDQCRNNCMFHREVEPNEISDAGTLIDAGSLYGGLVSSATDSDFFAFDVPYVADVRVETFDSTGPNNCGNSVDTIASLYTPNVVFLASDNDDGVAACSLIQPSTDVGARQLAPGRYYVKVSANLNSFVPQDYVLKLDLLTRCGDSVVEGYEQCDGTAGCGTDCKRIAVCGDGYVDGAETCDDNNTTSGDGCSATCQREQTAEIEPNGTTAAATPLPTRYATGAITPLADKDYYRVVVPTAGVVHFETFDSTGLSCVNIATQLRVYDSVGTQLFTDSTTGIANCSALSLYLSAGTYYVSVEESGNNATISAYVLEVLLLGNGGNETEANDTDQTANPIAQNNVYVFGGHQNGADIDTFSFPVAAGHAVRIELVEGNTETCENLGVDSELDLIDPNGNIIANDDDSGRGYCSLIDGSGGAVAALTGAGNLPAGTYKLRVRHSDFVADADPEAQFDYRLVVTIR